MKTYEEGTYRDLLELGYREVPKLEAEDRDRQGEDVLFCPQGGGYRAFWFYRPPSDIPPQKVMPLWCPWCGKRHVDQGKFAEHPHHTHRCVDDPYGDGCQREWRLQRYVFGAR